MFQRKKDNRPRNLYETFRDGLLEEANRGHDRFDLWHLLPPAHIGRLQTLTLIRKMVSQLNKDFPGSVVDAKGNTMALAPTFVEFVQTHWSMGSTEEEARAAWQAMKELV